MMLCTCVHLGNVVLCNIYVCELLCVYTAECIYNTQQQLVKLLKNFCMNPKAARGKNIKVSKMR